jgi:hypothetical protein
MLKDYQQFVEGEAMAARPLMSNSSGFAGRACLICV